jgi:hypothetical protein
MDNTVVGKIFNAWDNCQYYCDSFDPRIGYWMTQIGDSSIRRNVSERAIGSSFREVRDYCVVNNPHLG